MAVCELLWACGVSFPDRGSNPEPPHLGAQSLSHWDTREVLTLIFNVSHLKQVLEIRKTYIYYTVIIFHAFEGSRMGKEKLRLWNESELSSIPALHALGSTVVKRG